MKEFEIWKEGYAATGEHQTAKMIGTGRGETFDEAVKDYIEKNEDHGVERVDRRSFTNEEAYKNRKSNWSVWACRLFDNEAEARKSFG